ncbi:WXG100 family type VII secretion target [Nocardia sp. NPDC050713]|uniref:WXG100 family type VII secretion target n=1 Tax=unclassified Nocardia TaxID=2637762 RepID=UPI0033B7D1DD
MTQSSSGESPFDVVPADVTDAGRYVQLTAEELINGVRSLDADITRLLETWSGTSASVYRAGWDEARQGAETVLESLGKLAELLGVVATTHTDLDSGRAANISSLELP